ncbi:winged helix-turn-helix domain-containing protein [Dactylosporangium sp. NPDC000244]|uniref:winged helix-turn-helix domain-containing protein n=1 Tax=Dactylosporangium sp. NPDC000244 TaxID=3154365 RepID=UPI0033288FE9
MSDEELTYLSELDPDDPTGAAQQIARQLRAAILTGRLKPAEKLPSQPDLAKHYGVARETVKRALDALRGERLIVSRQGSGVFVRAQTQRPVELRPHLEAAFEREEVTIDFAGFIGETLQGALAEVLDQVRAGQLAPKRITIRVMVSDMRVPMALPARADTGADDPIVRERMERISHRSLDAIVDQVHELADLGLIESATVTVRQHSASPLFKLYIINNSEVFFGFYPAIERTVSYKGEPLAIYDLLGKDVPLFNYAVSEEDTSHGTQFVGASKQWFDSVWDSVAREYQG